MELRPAGEMIKKWPLDMTAPEVSGKTKRIIPVEGKPGIVCVSSKDALTKNNDPAETKNLLGKAVLSTDTTVNIFRLFGLCGIPTAYIERDFPRSFIALDCDMIKLEVVGRVRASGSYRKRNPGVYEEYERLPKRVIELFLKTSGKKWGDINLPDDDPFAVYCDRGFELYHPAKPVGEQTPVMITRHGVLGIENATQLETAVVVERIRAFALRGLLVLEKVFALFGWTLCDVKFEFGFARDGRLVMADVVDADSMRVRDPEGVERSKQAFRDNKPLDEVRKGFEMIARLSKGFTMEATNIIVELA